MVVAVGKGKW